MLASKWKRKNLTISERYQPMMDEIIDECEESGKSLSEHLCKLAVREHSKEKKKAWESDLDLPSVDKIVEYMLKIKMDLADEVIRLYNKKEITDEQLVMIYLGITALNIQFNKTDLIMSFLDLANDNDLIYSKRQATNKMAIEKSTGRLIDIARKLKSKQEELKEKKEGDNLRKVQRTKAEEKWKAENPEVPLKYMGMTKDEIETQQLIDSGMLEPVDDE